MFSIKRDEALHLRKIGYGDYVKVTHSRYKKYFAVETYKVKDALSRYRTSIVTASNFGE